ncbi:2-hydroxyacid dehydrogenase [Pseudonocardia nigra]|uniref:2-hydroxyacid dehydrogenase n=1 Tax=Pseudonocardia nigra TaxID=1921578 RepID=UPI001C5EC566|nr:D-glycerate dehydrogenase [Pseudonocardia nigra]
MPDPVVVVTRRWPAEVEDELCSRFPDVRLNADDRPLGPEGLRRALCEADAVLPTVSDQLPAELFSGGTRTRFLGNFGVGFNHIDVAAAARAGIVVTNTPGVLTEATADLAMTLLLMVARRTGEGERELRGGGWGGWRPTHLVGAEVSGKTLGIIGMGRIGAALARRGHCGFQMPVVYHDSHDQAERPDIPWARKLDTVEEVLEIADFVSLHVPGGGPNTHLMDAERLARMKPTAYLVNTARGDVVDTLALVEALTAGTIAGAGLDVYEGEPDIPEDLRRLDNAVLLPHLGSATRETRIAMGRLVLDNLQAFVDGREPPCRVA